MEARQREIMEQSRHLWIYGKNGEERRKILQNLEVLYPVKLDRNCPIAVYMNSFILPTIEERREDYDRTLASIAARNHFDFAIAENVIRKIEDDSILLPDKFLAIVNRLFLNKKHSKIESIHELLEILKTSKLFFEHYYVSELTGTQKEDIESLKIQFLMIDGFIRYLKQAMNNQSYFGIILDHQAPFPIETTMAINNFVSKRCNSDISVKVALEPDEWETYYDANGILIEAIHDYGTVELDDSLKQYVKTKIN